MKKYFILLIFLTHFAIQSHQFEQLNSIVKTGKVFFENIIDGAHETWDDLKEVYDEVSLEFSEKIKDGYEKITTKINIKNYLINQIGQAEVTFFQISRKINNRIDEFLPKIESWLVERKHATCKEDLQDFFSLIDSPKQQQIAQNFIEQMHDDNFFVELFDLADNEFKRVQFEFLFTCYAHALLNQNYENADDIYTALACAKVFLKHELGIF